jgi:hypothetical protein
MPQHMDPAFLEPTPPAVEPKDTETGDLWDLPAEEPETKDTENEPRASLRVVSGRRRGGRPEHVRTIIPRVLRALLEGRAA